jgi:universal stress protein A|tara:strand:+ start:303 stop:737 length:435 start_codon:yes stop_codon:yes gene_type:complete
MYNTILAAVDLSKDSLKVLDKAVAAANGDNSNIHLAHVVEPVAAAYSIDIYAVNITELQQEAISMTETKLKEIAKRLDIDETKAHTLLGAPGPEIRNLAAGINADAIVIGSHGHSGWKILLGSTAIKVLHGATCDVLTVHVGEA